MVELIFYKIYHSFICMNHSSTFRNIRQGDGACKHNHTWWKFAQKDEYTITKCPKDQDYIERGSGQGRIGPALKWIYSFQYDRE